MKITTKNYFSIIDKYGKDLPEGLKLSSGYLLSETQEGKDWSRYKTDKEFKKVSDLSFQKLEEYLASKFNKHGSTPKPKGKSKSRRSKYVNMDLECEFIERFLEFHDQVVDKNTFGIFIFDLQTAILNHRITKDSPVAKEITEIQEAAIRQFNAMYKTAHFILKPATIKHLKGILAKRENAYDDIDEKFAKPKRDTTPLEGIQEAPTAAQPNIISSTDLANREFKTIGFDGKWKELIGDPCPGFKVSVSGMPKMGKSFLCVEFANYLASRFGKVLYVAKEEFLSPTFQMKLKEKNVQNPNLDIAGTIPSDLSPYESIFLDSVTSLKLSADDLKVLEDGNPGKNFIYIHQVTKAGKARGSNEFIHNVDSIIEVPERGKAIQYGRFNQGGKMDIFPTPAPEQLQTGLNGTSKKKENDWTEAKGLTDGDKFYLKEIKKCVEQEDWAGAMDWASRGDTEVREAIPGEIWLKMGGSLTETGWKKLKERGFTSQEIKKLQEEAREKLKKRGLTPDEDSEPKVREISFAHNAKPKTHPVGADIYRYASSLNEINTALRGLKGDLENRMFKKIKVGEYLDIVKIAVRKHPDLFAFTEDVTAGLQDILLRLTDSAEDWKKGITPDTVKPEKYPKRKGQRMHFTSSPGIDVLSLYYEKYIKKSGDKKFSETLADAVENDDLLYYNLAEFERLFARILEQISNATKARKDGK